VKKQVQDDKLEKIILNQKKITFFVTQKKYQG